MKRSDSWKGFLQPFFISRRILKSDEDYTDERKKMLIGFILMGIDVTFGLTIGFIFYRIFKSIPPVENGFYCNDKSLSMPLLPNSISRMHLLAVTLALPFFIILVCEAIFFRQAYGKGRLSKFFFTSTLLYLQYLFAYIISMCVMEVLKRLIGRLRPHFFEGCQVDWTKTECDTRPDAFIHDVICLGESKQVHTSRTSFPSGHSTVASLFFIWLFLYIQGITRACNSSLLSRIRLFLLPSSLLWTSFCLVSRVTDHWHHTSDVIGGLLLSVVCVFAVYGWKPLPSKIIYEMREVDIIKEE